MRTLYVRSGSHYRPARSTEILDGAAALAARQAEAARLPMTSPPLVRDFLKAQLAHCEEEHFCILFLDSRNRLIAFERLFRGTVDGASVHPREVVKEVLARNAAAVILAHNHPSGVAEPSSADEHITRQLRQALDLIEVRILDHVIVAGQSACSFAERGLL